MPQRCLRPRRDQGGTALRHEDGLRRREMCTWRVHSPECERGPCVRHRERVRDAALREWKVHRSSSKFGSDMRPRDGLRSHEVRCKTPTPRSSVPPQLRAPSDRLKHTHTDLTVARATFVVLFFSSLNSNRLLVNASGWPSTQANRALPILRLTAANMSALTPGTSSLSVYRSLYLPFPHLLIHLFPLSCNLMLAANAWKD